MKTALVIDPDTGFTNTILECIPDIAVANDGIQAHSAIRDEDSQFAAVFLSSSVLFPSVLPLLKTIRQLHPVTPIFLTYETESPFAKLEQNRLSLAGTLRKDQLLVDLRSQTHKSAQAAKRLGENFLNGPLPRSVTPAGFLSVQIEEFLGERPLFFDVYFRTPTEKLLKIASAGQILETDRVLKYARLGGRHLYLKEASFARCLDYCDLLAEYLVKCSRASTEIKFLHSVQKAQKFLEQLRTISPDEVHLDYGILFLGELIEIVRNSRGQIPETVSRFLKHATVANHGLCVAAIAGFLALPLQIETDHLFTQLGLAALLHDIGLNQLPLALHHENLSAMTERERNLYKSHPQIGAELIKQFKMLDENAIQGVAQHHERRTAGGFPNKVAPGEINLFAEIIGISDEFVQLIMKNGLGDKKALLYQMENEVFPGFSLRVIEAFQKVFSGY